MWNLFFLLSDNTTVYKIEKIFSFLCTVHVASTLILPAMHCLSLHWSQTAAINTPADFLSPAELPRSSLALAAVWFVAFNCLFLSSFTV